jgi:RimJ/RimL family protein N-acetyltransferase
MVIDGALAYLERDRLRNIVPLKMLHAHSDACEVHVAASGNGVLIELNPNAFSYDRQHYPDADGIILISSDDALTTRALLQKNHVTGRLVFKLQNKTDALEVRRCFDIRRVTAFESFTDASAFSPDPNVRITLEPTPTMLDSYAQRDYSRQWLEPLLVAGKAFCCEIGDAESVCLAFENFANVWEVGGVFTPETLRGRGLAARVVKACIAELQTRGLHARYQVEESNAASIAVAKRIGLEHVLTVTHWTNH